MANRVTHPLPDGEKWADSGTHKQCRWCHLVKSRDEFYNRQARCKECIKLEVRTNIHKDVNKHNQRSKEYSRNRDPQERYAAHLKSKYGISWGDYLTLIQISNNCCWICKNPCVSGRKLAVDHDHETGEVRGVLCGLCNKALGVFEKDDLLEKAKRYLEEKPWRNLSGL